MIVYHGTSMSAWKKIRQSGLVPRGETWQSNWTHSIESNPDTIYLTDAYAMHFALSAIRGNQDHFEEAVVIEIDTSRLDQSNLVADEDALEQVSRKQDGLPPEWSMQDRTRHYRGMVRRFQEFGYGFEWSMQELGTGGHIGVVPPEAFRRVAYIDVQAAAELAWAYMDGQVSVMNYKFLGPRLRSMSRQIFGDKPFPKDKRDQLSQHMPSPKIGPGIRVLHRSDWTAIPV